MAVKKSVSETPSFSSLVDEIVSLIPRGKVMTYGDIAVVCGKPYAARQVGALAHFGDEGLPWHRVVNRLGDCASGYPGGKAGHQQVLIAEGFSVELFRITDFRERKWLPKI